jgi:hypothetical protein
MRSSRNRPRYSSLANEGFRHSVSRAPPRPLAPSRSVTCPVRLLVGHERPSRPLAGPPGLRPGGTPCPVSAPLPRGSHRDGASSGSTSAFGSARAGGAGQPQLGVPVRRCRRRRPGCAATARRPRIRQSAGRPTGVMPPYSMPVASTTAAAAAKRRLARVEVARTSLLTSARVWRGRGTRRTSSRHRASRRRRRSCRVLERQAVVGAERLGVGQRRVDLDDLVPASPPRSRMAAATGAATRSRWSAAGCQSSVGVSGTGSVCPRDVRRRRRDPPRGVHGASDRVVRQCCLHVLVHDQQHDTLI